MENVPDQRKERLKAGRSPQGMLLYNNTGKI